MTETYTANILDVLTRATAKEHTDGAAWYGEAHNLAVDIANGNAWAGAGVIAAFSPMCPWNRNVSLARNAFDTGIATGHTKAMCSLAQRIIDGENTLDVLRGDKTRAFASAIATNGMSDIATIDRHAHDIAMGRVFTDNERKIGKRVYREMASAYSDAARVVDLSTNQIQAITWVVWRREKGIK